MLDDEHLFQNLVESPIQNVEQDDGGDFRLILEDDSPEFPLLIPESPPTPPIILPPSPPYIPPEERFGMLELIRSVFETPPDILNFELEEGEGIPQTPSPLRFGPRVCLKLPLGSNLKNLNFLVLF